MTRRGLLSRIGEPTLGPVSEAQAVLAHLRVLLNTRQGDAPSVPLYGVIDFNDIVHGIPTNVPQIVDSIRNTIVEHEPRLTNVKVCHVPDDGPVVLRFEISAELSHGRSSRTLRFNTTVQPGGRIDVSG